jgi:hypothetical protein
MEKINARYGLESNGETSFRIIDCYKQEVTGDFWSSNGTWVFQLNDGRSRMGGYTKVLKSMKLMLRAN